jgi:hypothetical protein
VGILTDDEPENRPASVVNHRLRLLFFPFLRSSHVL